MKGAGVARDAVAAAAWLEKSGRAGSAKGAWNAAILRQDGGDAVGMLEWARIAAKLGHASAKAFLAAAKGSAARS